MNREEILAATATELSQKIRAGETTVKEAAEAVLYVIEEKEETLHCYVTIDKLVEIHTFFNKILYERLDLFGRAVGQ